jgi:hypothetical protein
LSPRKFTFFISQAFSNSLEASTYKSDVRNIKNKIPLALELKVHKQKVQAIAGGDICLAALNNTAFGQLPLLPQIAAT